MKRANLLWDRKISIPSSCLGCLLCIAWLLCWLGIDQDFGSRIAVAEDWPQFRGPNFNGVTTPDSYPTHWSSTEGVRWSAEMPRGGNGSPIVASGCVFVTSAGDEEGRQRGLLCFDAETGELLWNRTVAFGQKMPTHQTNPYGGTTPASNGKFVAVWHGSAGLHVYDHAGEKRWSRDLGEFRHMWGYGTSPVIVGDRVIMHAGPGQRVFVVAFDLETGQELWRHEEPVEGSGERNLAGHYMGSWSTPVPISQGDRELVVCAMATRVCGIDVQSGEIIWQCDGLRGDRGDLAYSSPMIEGDLCVMIGGFQGPGFGFQMIGRGKIADRHRLWANTKNPQNIGTGLLIDGYVYRLGAGPAIIDCLDAKTGQRVWQDRAVGGTYWGSLVYDGKNAMATDQNGATLLFQPSSSGFAKVALNELGDRCNATPALADGRVYIRTYGKLWCLGD